jgi:MFS family permease
VVRSFVDAVAPGARAVRQVLRSSDLRRLELAYIGFNMAEWATWIAILVWAYGVGGPSAVGFVAMIQLVPAALFAPLAATLADRFRRERVVVLSYLIQTAAMGATAAAIWSGSPAAVVVIFAASATTAITITRPAQGALLPELAETPEELTAANAASTTIEGMSVLAGPAVAGILLSVSGPGTVFGVMSGWLLISTGVAGTIRNPNAVVTGRGPTEGVGRELLRGFGALRARRDARLIIDLLGTHALVWGILDVLIVVLAIEVLRLGESGVGYLNSALGLGALIGGIGAVMLAGRPRLAPAVGLGVALWGLSISVIGAAPMAIAAALLLVFAGSGHSLLDVAGRTLLQRIVPSEVLSRVLGVLEGAAMAALAVGAIVAPFLERWLGARGALVVAGAFLPALAAARSSRLWRLDDRAVVPTEGIRLLRPIPLFAPLAPAAIERLAAALVRLDVAAGATVIRQGDVGDLFYVVEEGQLEASMDGEFLGPLGPGNHFGEIALLRSVPRTATVTARTDARLHALDRDTFIAAVTGHAWSARAADVVIEARLKDQIDLRERMSQGDGDRIPPSAS